MLHLSYSKTNGLKVLTFTDLEPILVSQHQKKLVQVYLSGQVF